MYRGKETEHYFFLELVICLYNLQQMSVTLINDELPYKGESQPLLPNIDRSSEGLKTGVLKM